MRVDIIVIGHVRPFVSGAITHDGDFAGGIVAFVADEDGRFTSADRRDHSIGDASDLRIVAGHHGFTSNITAGPIGVMGDDENLLSFTRQA